MKEIKGDLFQQRHDAICITTNGFVTKAGYAVMGKGCAKEASRRMSGLPTILAHMIKRHGNRVNLLGVDKGTLILSYPVKPISVVFETDADVVKHMRGKFKKGDIVPGWATVADLEIIKKSAYQLSKIAYALDLQSVCIPRPGCGAGELSWDTVRTTIGPILDDRFEIITFS